LFKEKKGFLKSDAEIKRLNEENVRLRRAVDELAILQQSRIVNRRQPGQ